MKTIRKGVFETNSSSTHSICIGTSEEFHAWERNEIFWSRYERKFITKEEVIADLRQSELALNDEELIEEVIRNPREFDVDTYDSWGEDYEMDSTTYTTKGGEVIHILCYYGNDY